MIKTRKQFNNLDQQSKRPLSPQETPTKSKKKLLSKSKLKQSILNPEEETHIEEIISPTNVFDGKFIPTECLFRSHEMTQITQFIQTDHLQCKFLMVTGLPGSGKTMVINKILQQLTQFKVIQINAMSCKSYADFLNEVLNAFQLKQPNQNKLFLKNLLTSTLLKSTEQTILMIDEFDNLFSSHDKDPLDLFSIAQSKNIKIKIIGVSNDIEFLSLQYKKNKLEMPNIQNVIFEPYTREQMGSIISQRISYLNQRLNKINNQQYFRQEKKFLIDDQTIKFCTFKCFNEKGADMRYMLDLFKRVCYMKSELDVFNITIEDITQEINKNAMKKASQQIVEQISLEQQIILIAIYLILKKDQNQKQEFDLNEINQKVIEIKRNISLDVNQFSKIEEHIVGLQDYKLVILKETTVKLNGGCKQTLKKVIPKIDLDDIKYSFQNLPAFKGIIT